MNDLFSLHGKVAIVTGALGLIGKHYCQALNQAGASVIVADTNGEDCRNYASQHLKNSLGVSIDVTDKNSIIKMVEEIVNTYGKIDVLVNNAAINDMFENPKASMEESKFENYPLELWQKTLNVNLTGVFLCSQIVGKQMLKQGAGNIINIASTYGITAPDQSIYKDKEGSQVFSKPPAYPVTKSGVIMFSKFLAAYWGNKGIRVNTLTPGGVQNGQSDFFIENYSKKTPLGKMAQPTDYKGAIVFLASDASAYMTGANLIVDGGWTCW